MNIAIFTVSIAIMALGWGNLLLGRRVSELERQIQRLARPER